MSHDHSSMSDGMDMSSMTDSTGRMPASHMNMVFFLAHDTSLLTSAFTPRTTGQYAGVIIFLIIFAFLYRGLFTLKNYLERHWAQTFVTRRYTVLSDKPGNASAGERLALASRGEGLGKEATLVVEGREEKVRVASSSVGVKPWKFSVDLPRAVLVTLIVAVGYLLMLVVMTMNVSYFLAILAGAFLGELAFGRFLDFQTHH